VILRLKQLKEEVHVCTLALPRPGCKPNVEYGVNSEESDYLLSEEGLSNL
jgi:hypothetical protein